MNERIKQITGQVLDEIVPETWVALGYDKIKEIQNRTAELIVRECIDIAKNWEDQLENANSLDESNAVGIVAYRIARQFGVEE